MTAMGSEPDLRLGDSGEWVTHLQQRLQALSLYGGGIDGHYGEGTEAALRQFAESAGIEHGDTVSAATWQALAYWEQQAGITPGVAHEGHAAYAGHAEHEGHAAHEGHAVAAASPAGQLSEDGQWRWDGSQWQPAGQEHGGTADQHGTDQHGDSGAAQAAGDRYTVAVNEEADDPSTDEAELLV
jgi:hypothetical protein